LLWEAVQRLKADSAAWFDLGGISVDAPGDARFKRGLGGAETTLVGGYI
jgi:lipid II:glycine glycyltransferase (peptidoglycan interpeptide bridge formation enzyme)